jgi:adenylate cyclase
MPIEIERKFLLASAAWRREVSRSLAMRQGYLGGEGGRASVRVRLEGDEARLNIKAAVLGNARAEYEYAVPVDEAREILDTLCVGCVEKTRHYVFVPAGGPGERYGLTWEIDEFCGDNAGLVVAELELEHPDQTFVIPGWLGREVTDERRYYNHALALRPYRDWTEDERA